jgi:hypothetical protein
MVRNSPFVRHVAGADLVEDGGMHGCEEAKLADLAQRNRERGGDRLRPVFGSEGFDRPPKVDACHWRPSHVLAERAHSVEVVGFYDDDVDLGQSDFDGEPHAPVAVFYCESAVFFGHGRGLDDADDLDAGL